MKRMSLCCILQREVAIGITIVFLGSDEGVNKFLPVSQVTKRLRVAVVVAGTLDRFIFNSMLEHLIRWEGPPSAWHLLS